MTLSRTKRRESDSDSAISSSGVNAESGTTTGHDSASTHSSAGCSCDRCETAGRRREEASRAADEPPERPLSSARRSMNAADRAAMDEREFLCERFTTTEPTCSHSLLSLEKKPKLHRLGEKLKKFITPRDEHHARQFQRLFSDYLAADEELIATFSCLYHDPERKLPLSGRLFVSSLSLAFSASAVHVRFVVPLVQVQRIVREQYAASAAKSDGIRIHLDDGVTCKFGSFASCEKAHAVLSRQWKSRREERDGRKTPLEMNLNPPLDDPLAAPTDTSSEISRNTDETSQSHEPAICECGEHRGQNLLDAVYPLSARQLFHFLFTENEQIREFHKIAKRTAVNYESWKDADESLRKSRRKQKRTTTYTVELANSFGPKSSDVTEKQTYSELGPQAVNGYTIEKDAVNAGIPYADAFGVELRYCITRISPTSCRLRVHGEIVYRKSVMGMFKGFIDRLTMSGMAEYYKSLDRYLRDNSTAIARVTAVQRETAGRDSLTSAGENGSFRSLTDGGGYESDVEEEEDSQSSRRQRVTRKSSQVDVHLPARPPLPSAVSPVQTALLADISTSLRVIAGLLLLLLLVQLWSTFVPPPVHEAERFASLADFVRHSDADRQLRQVQKWLLEIEHELAAANAGGR